MSLSSIPDTYFSECTELRDIILSYNHLSAIPDLSTVSNTLTLLMLNYNDLTDVKPLQDLDFPNLQYVYLEHNQIHQVGIDRFHVPRLLGMDLSYNLIQELGHPISLVPSVSKHRDDEEHYTELKLEGNPWRCNVKLSWVVSALLKPYKVVTSNTTSVYLCWPGSPVRVMNTQAMICYTPLRMRGKPVMHASRYWSSLPPSLD